MKVFFSFPRRKGFFENDIFSLHGAAFYKGEKQGSGKKEHKIQHTVEGHAFFKYN